MAVKMSIVSIILLVVLMHWNGATAQSGCTTALVSLAPCITYVTGNSSTPSSSCCSRLSSVVDSQPRCLCTLLNGGASNFGIAVNQTLALALPGACNVQTPPVSRCDAAKGPAASASAPANSPSESPADEEPEVPATPSETDIPSGNAGSKTVPSTDGSAVAGSNVGATFSIVGTLVLIASSWAFSGTGF